MIILFLAQLFPHLRVDHQLALKTINLQDISSSYLSSFIFVIFIILIIQSSIPTYILVDFFFLLFLFYLLFIRIDIWLSKYAENAYKYIRNKKTTWNLISILEIFSSFFLWFKSPEKVKYKYWKFFVSL